MQKNISVKNFKYVTYHFRFFSQMYSSVSNYLKKKCLIFVKMWVLKKLHRLKDIS